MRLYNKFYSIIKRLERELNETHNLKRRLPEFPLEIAFPAWIPKNGWGVFYQKSRGFRIWGPNHYTRASLVSCIAPNVAGSGWMDLSIRSDPGNVSSWMAYWDLRIGQGTGVTVKGDTTLKDASPVAANTGTMARIDVANPAVYQRQYSAVFNANALPSGYVIREVGLYMKAGQTETISGQNFTNGSVYMVARLSTSDNDFSPYTPNIALPLTVNWIIQWSL